MSADPTLAICSVGELFGGVERHILGMCTWLLRKGQEPLLILFHDAELAHQARLLGVEPIILRTNGSLDLGAPRRLAAIFQARTVTVVHAHGYRAVVNCAMAHRYYKFSLVRTVHGLVEPHGGMSRAWLKAKAYTRLERFWARRVGSAVSYVTENLQAHHRNFDRGLDARTVPNGIDPLRRDDFPRPPEFLPGVMQVVLVGRITEVKGIPYALEAMKKISTESPVWLNIIGTGPMEHIVQDQIEENGLAGRVRILGFRKNIYDYIANADVLLMPSLHEGAPYTILEAMSLGLPIVASRTGGLPELLTNEESGILVDVGDSTGLGKALTMLLKDRTKRLSLGEGGRVEQERRFSLDVMGDAFWHFYCDRHEQNGLQS